MHPNSTSPASQRGSPIGESGGFPVQIIITAIGVVAVIAVFGAVALFSQQTVGNAFAIVDVTLGVRNDFTQIQREVAQTLVAVALLEEDFDERELDVQRQLTQSRFNLTEVSLHGPQGRTDQVSEFAVIASSLEESQILDPENFLSRFDSLQSEWTALQPALDDYQADPSDGDLRTELTERLTQLEADANILSLQFWELSLQSQRNASIANQRLISGLTGVLLVFAALVVVALFNVVRLQRQREAAEEKTRLALVAESIARKEAEQANNAKTSFLANTSHELRTPLNSIINLTSLVRRGAIGPVNERQEELLTLVWDSSRNLLSLINDVLDMSKIESGSLKLYKQPGVDLAAIITSAHDSILPLVKGNPVALKVDIQENLPTLTADENRLRQILLNLLSNAVKFTEAGEICVEARQQDQSVLITVRDTGSGIAPEDVGLVFEQFAQTEAGLRQGAGTGLGMPITKSLVEAHGGRIWLESEVDVGTTFYVELPIAPDEALVAAPIKQGADATP